MRLAILATIPIALFSQAATAQCPMSCANGKTEWNFGYNAGIPLGEMGLHANTLHSFATGGYYRVPKSLGRIDVGAEMTLGSYANFSRTQNFVVNGVEMPVIVNYNSGVTTGSAVFRYNYFRSNTLTAFVAAKGGIAGFSSRIQIEDPEEEDGCKPLEDNKLISDHTWIAGARTGANVDMQSFFKKMRGQTFMLQAFVGYVQGGNVDYINIKKSTTDNPHRT